MILQGDALAVLAKLPDYRWINNVTEGETAIEPEGWREAVYHTPDGKTPRLWRRINLWRGHDYFYDNEAVKEPASLDGITRRLRADHRNKPGWDAAYSGNPPKGPQSCNPTPKRNRRDVWTIATKPYRGAHFAVFPPDIPEICIKAGTSERGCCPVCGAPWVRVVERTADVDETAKGSFFDRGKTGARDGGDRTQPGERYLKQTIGFSPSCSCGAGKPVPCTVLDPFAGSGTVGAVAKSLGRDYILIEANPDYIELIEARLAAAERPPATLEDFE